MVVVLLDVFPATLTGGGFPATPGAAVHASQGRVLVTRDEVLCFVESGTHTNPATLVGRWELVSVAGGQTTGWRLETTTDLLHLRRAKGCGCGSRLRGLRLLDGAVAAPAGSVPPLTASP